MSLVLRPISIREASRYVARWHRHLPPPQGALWASAAWRPDGTEPVGVILVGRPLARNSQDGVTCEVVRCSVAEGERNAPSFLYGAAKRIAQAMGYRRMLTKTLTTESGATMRAIGAMELPRRPAQEWDRPSRQRSLKGGAQLVEKRNWSLFDERESV